MRGADSLRDEVGIFVDAVLAIIEPVESHFPRVVDLTVVTSGSNMWPRLG
jgi:hypothetical protein